MDWKRLVFLIAGIYGILVLAPMYFMEKHFAENHPPAITHPEHYYGFIGVALAFQVIFLMISRDPARFRPVILAGVFEKFSYGIAIVVLLMQGRVERVNALFGTIDLVFGILFLAAWWNLRESAPVSSARV